MKRKLVMSALVVLMLMTVIISGCSRVIDPEAYDMLQLSYAYRGAEIERLQQEVIRLEKEVHNKEKMIAYRDGIIDKQDSQILMLESYADVAETILLANGIEYRRVK